MVADGTLAEVTFDRIIIRKLIQSSPFRHYVYVLHRSNGDPFYVGKGQQYRLLMHVYKASDLKYNKHVTNVIRKMQRNGDKIGYSIASWHHDSDDALEHEKMLIAKIGTKAMGTGPLCNHTTGGECPKHISTFEERSRAAKARHAARTPEERSAIAKKGKQSMTPEERSAAARKGIAAQPPGVISARRKKVYADKPHLLEQLSERSRKWHQTDAGKASTRLVATKLTAFIKSRTPEQRSAMAKKAYASKSPELRRALAINASAKRTPESIRRQAKALSETWRRKRIAKMQNTASLF